MIKRLSIAVITALTVLAFQNCGKGGFDTSEALGSNSLASSATVPGEVTAPKTCPFNGQSLSEGQSITAYQSSTSTNSCVSQTRTCRNGVLSGTYAYANCSVGQPASCLFNGVTIPSGQSVPAYVSSSVAYGQSCQGETRVCTSGVLSGSYTASNCTVARPNITGTWVQTCRVHDSGSVQQTEVFNGGAFQISARIAPLDTGCRSVYANVVVTGNYTVGDEIPVGGFAVNKLNLSNVQTAITPANSFAAIYLNSINFCGLTNWTGGVPLNITGRNCSISGYAGMIPSGALYTSFRILNGNALYQAVPNSTMNGLVEALRPLDPDSIPLIKQ